MSLHLRAASGAEGAIDENAVVEPPLSQAIGYVVVVVIGLIIAFSAWEPSNHHSRLTDTSRSHDVCNSTAEADRWRRQQED